jgi:hypothetical protein
MVIVLAAGVLGLLAWGISRWAAVPAPPFTYTCPRCLAEHYRIAPATAALAPCARHAGPTIWYQQKGSNQS